MNTLLYTNSFIGNIYGDQDPNDFFTVITMIDTRKHPLFAVLSKMKFYQSYEFKMIYRHLQWLKSEFNIKKEIRITVLPSTYRDKGVFDLTATTFDQNITEVKHLTSLQITNMFDSVAQKLYGHSIRTSKENGKNV